MMIRQTGKADLDDALDVEARAFGEEEAPLIKELVINLLNDPSAMPCLSLLAEKDGLALGHILYSKAYINSIDDPCSVMLLAPLAVVPEAQSQGIGGALVKEGLRLLTKLGVDLVFVLGHPDYYPRHGFTPAGVLGLDAPYPILKKNASAWMVQELHPGVIGRVRGKLICADALDQAEYWVE